MNTPMNSTGMSRRRAGSPAGLEAADIKFLQRTVEEISESPPDYNRATLSLKCNALKMTNARCH
jgi:hypothetical protein